MYSKTHVKKLDFSTLEMICRLGLIRINSIYQCDTSDTGFVTLGRKGILDCDDNNRDKIITNNTDANQKYNYNYG